MRAFNKIFGIGLSRTGTTSLTMALEYLGIPTIHWPTNMLDICKYRGATDITVACRFKELDQIFPDSLFVYTERDRQSWLRSVVAHYAKRDLTEDEPYGAQQFAREADIRIYGKIWPRDCNFAQCYQKHHAEVLKYFQGRSECLLRLNITKNNNWNKLCQFLELPIPAQPFPHLHQKKYPTTGAVE